VKGLVHIMNYLAMDVKCSSHQHSNSVDILHLDHRYVVDEVN